MVNVIQRKTETVENNRPAGGKNRFEVPIEVLFTGFVDYPRSTSCWNSPLAIICGRITHFIELFNLFWRACRYIKWFLFNKVNKIQINLSTFFWYSKLVYFVLQSFHSALIIGDIHDLCDHFVVIKRFLSDTMIISEPNTSCSESLINYLFMGRNFRLERPKSAWITLFMIIIFKLTREYACICDITLAAIMRF